MTAKAVIDLEASIFSCYLIGRTPNKAALVLYEGAVANLPPPNQLDQAMLRFAIKHPSSIGYLDAGLIFYRPHSELRHRLYIMLAILEAQPEYCDSFLPKKRRLFYLGFLVWCGVRSVFKIILGSILVRSFRA